MHALAPLAERRRTQCEVKRAVRFPTRTRTPGQVEHDIICVGTQDSEYTATAGTFQISDCQIECRHINSSYIGRDVLIRAFEIAEDASVQTMLNWEGHYFESMPFKLSEGAVPIVWPENEIEFKKSSCETLVLQVVVADGLETNASKEHSDENEQDYMAVKYMMVLNSAEFANMGPREIVPG